jgi:hypothetical protein
LDAFVVLDLHPDDVPMKLANQRLLVRLGLEIDDSVTEGLL